MLEGVTKDQIEEWMHHPVTEAVLKRFKDEKDFVAEQLCRGNTLVPRETEFLTGRAVGTLDGLNFFIDRDFLDND